ncbi:tetratricopeptide repeat protein [bacterium]|nr:tetratricopeptide repeat protein [bacterium]
MRRVRPCVRPSAFAILLTLGVCLSYSAPALAADPSAQFQEANRLYNAADFAGAAAVYQQLAESGQAGADVWYNLGNCYAQEQQYGRALAAYQAGCRVAPRDPDLLNNIAQVQTLRGDVPPVVPASWLGALSSGVLSRFTLNETIVGTLLLLMLCAALALAYLLRIGRPRRVLVALGGCGLLLVLAVSACTGKYLREYVHPIGFVAVSQAGLRSGPGEHFESAGSLADGTQLDITGESGQWFEVRRPEGHRAWITKAEVARY